MIAFIRGVLVDKNALGGIIDVNGIGYEVHMPVTATERLPSVGDEVVIHTCVIYKEDSQTMYGFSSREERDFFLLLVEKVSGIGPKITLNILSRMPIGQLKEAIARGDESLLTECPGIGKKTAARLTLELKDKVFSADMMGSGLSVETNPLKDLGVDRVHQDVVAALMSLGYKAAQADSSVKAAIRDLPRDEELNTQVILKRVLS